MTRKQFLAVAVAIVFMFLCSGSALAIYSWVDEKGQTHISDYPKPENPDEHASVDEDKGKGSAAPAPSGRALKTDAQPAGESAQHLLTTTAPVPVQLNEQPGAPISPNQPRLDTVSAPAVTPPAVPPQPGTEISSAAPQPAVPFGTSGPATAGQQSGVPQRVKTFLSMARNFLIAAYLYFSLCLYLIARKLKVSGAWIAWVPLFQILTFMESASKPAWWALLLFVPVVNAIVSIYLWMCISENLGRGKWLGLLMLVPVVNLVFPGVLAFSNQDSNSDVDVAVS